MRSGSEHCGSRVAVEQGRRGRRGGRGGGEEEEEQEEEQEEEEATDIKSNNPHLAGGELSQPQISWIRWILMFCPISEQPIGSEELPIQQLMASLMGHTSQSHPPSIVPGFKAVGS